MGPRIQAELTDYYNHRWSMFRIEAERTLASAGRSMSEERLAREAGLREELRRAGQSLYADCVNEVQTERRVTTNLKFELHRQAQSRQTSDELHFQLTRITSTTDQALVELQEYGEGETRAGQMPGYSGETGINW
eukprot:1077038-Amphidinium_carterae.1